MLLKKQTVWLLTMLSLVVVLSVYYVTSDPGRTDLAAGLSDNAKEEQDALSASEQDLKIMTEAAGDEVFETVRMDIRDKRSKAVDDIMTEVAAPDLTAEEKNELYEKVDQIKGMDVKEQTIETMIKGLGYNDALVRADEGQVLITVTAMEEDHTKADAAQILRIVREEIGTQIAATVEFK